MRARFRDAQGEMAAERLPMPGHEGNQAVRGGQEDRPALPGRHQELEEAHFTLGVGAGRDVDDAPDEGE